MLRKLFFYTSIVAFFGVIFAHSTFADATLTKQQEAWLVAHNRTVTVFPQKSLAPYVFAGSGTVRKIKGLSAEYLEVIAKKYAIKLVYGEPASQSEILQKVREGDEGLVLSLTPTEDLGQYFYFSDAYIKLPAVIVTRKDYKEKKTTVTLADFSGKHVAVGKTYAVAQYIQTNYPKVFIDSVNDDEVALQKLLLGEVDAAVMDLASLSYYTSNDVLSYVKAVGRTGFEYQHSFAVPKSSPELLLILDNGLKEMSEAEKQIITERWIGGALTTLNDGGASAIRGKEEKDNSLLLIVLVFLGFIVVVIAAAITIVTIRKTQFKFSFNKGERKKDDCAHQELAELEAVQKNLQKELEHIEVLEKTIEEKIQ